jgi:branched-chain amino acid transport system substrate-binding protein
MPENRLTADLFSRSSAIASPRIILLAGALLFGIAGSVQAAGDIAIVRDLASRVGPVIGSAQACRDIARPRIQTIIEKFWPKDAPP